MIRFKLKMSNWHILPLLILYTLVIIFVDLDKYYEISKRFALVVYSLQVIVSIINYYAVLIINMFDLTRTYIGKGCQPPWIIHLLRKIGPFLTYLVFIGRIWLLSGMEAASIILLYVTVSSIQLNEMIIGYYLLPLMIIIILFHTLFEHSRLGKNAIDIKNCESTAQIG
jgi:hypothetical protein